MKAKAYTIFEVRCLMFELTISLTIDKQHYINKLFKTLAQDVKRCAGIAIKQNYQGRSFFSFAVDVFHKEYFKAKILDFVVFVISDDYKFNYYLNNLNHENTSVLFEPFVRAISIFDADCDREIIKSQIDFSGEILLDSFFYFKLQTLQNRWRKTAETINSNKILSNSSAMLEVLRYLTEMSDSLIVKTDISITNKQIRLKGMNISKCFKQNIKGQSSFLAEIISLNPSKINLKVSADDDSFGEKMVDVLTEVFADKIYLIN